MSTNITSSEKRKNARSLDTIADEIHKFQRVNVFVVGDLLVEAKAACEHGEWLDWLDQHFGWSDSSAERYMNVARLGTQIPQLRNLKLAKTTLYALVEEHGEDDLPSIIAELEKRATKKQLKPSDAKDVIEIAVLRREFGDLPEATLRALEETSGKGAWCAKAVEALKAEHPTTAAAADKVVNDIHHAHVEALYAPHGKLPNIPTEELGSLEVVPEGRRAKVLDRLLKAHQQITNNDVFNAIYSSGLGPSSLVSPDDEPASNDDDHGDGPEPATPTEPSQESPLDPELLAALKIVLRHALLRPVPKVVVGISGMELSEVARFAEELHRALHAGNTAKLAADRAEACSRSNQSAETKQSEPHPLDIPPSLIRRTQDVPDPGPDADRWIET
jgi:hypothetical protein